MAQIDSIPPTPIKFLTNSCVDHGDDDLTQMFRPDPRAVDTGAQPCDRRTRFHFLPSVQIRPGPLAWQQGHFALSRPPLDKANPDLGSKCAPPLRHPHRFGLESPSPPPKRQTLSKSTLGRGSAAKEQARWTKKTIIFARQLSTSRRCQMGMLFHAGARGIDRFVRKRSRIIHFGWHSAFDCNVSIRRHARQQC